MERKFWLDRWKTAAIGFHQPRPNPWLVEHWGAVVQAPASPAPVFVPLCGKSLDMRYLEQQGHSVVGIDFAEIAVRAYFEDAGEAVERGEQDGLTRYQGKQTTLYCGDFFELTQRELEPVQFAFDRGALVAMPGRLRRQYADHLLRVLPSGTRMLLVVLEYDQALVSGPPFSVLPEEVEALFGGRCEVQQLSSHGTDQVPPHFQEQGVRRTVEAAYLIVKSD